jgi:hypothetical protein
MVSHLRVKWHNNNIRELCVKTGAKLENTKFEQKRANLGPRKNDMWRPFSLFLTPRKNSQSLISFFVPKATGWLCPSVHSLASLLRHEQHK